jgi:hypothetical protein
MRVDCVTPNQESIFLDEFLNLEEKTIVNKDSDIFVAVVKCYNVKSAG